MATNGVLEFINKNNLSLLIWLDANDNTTIQQTINSLTIHNSVPNLSHIFFTASGSNVPIVHSSLGLGFFRQSALFISNMSFFRRFDSYTIIAVTSDPPIGKAQYYSLQKTINPKPLLKQHTNNLDISFSNTVLNVNLGEKKDVLVISHNLPLGRVRNLSTKEYTDETGRIFSGFVSNFVLGNSPDFTNPLNTYLSHFLLFIPEINDISVIEGVINRLPITRAVRGNSGFTLGSHLENYDLDFTFVWNYLVKSNVNLLENYRELLDQQLSIVVELNTRGVFAGTLDQFIYDLNVDSDTDGTLRTLAVLYENLINSGTELFFSLNDATLVSDFQGLFIDLLILLVFDVYYDLNVKSFTNFKLSTFHFIQTHFLNNLENSLDNFILVQTSLFVKNVGMALLNTTNFTKLNINQQIGIELIKHSAKISEGLVLENIYENINYLLRVSTRVNIVNRFGDSFTDVLYRLDISKVLVAIDGILQIYQHLEIADTTLFFNMNQLSMIIDFQNLITELIESIIISVSSNLAVRVKVRFHISVINEIIHVFTGTFSSSLDFFVMFQLDLISLFTANIVSTVAQFFNTVNVNVFYKSFVLPKFFHTAFRIVFDNFYSVITIEPSISAHMKIRTGVGEPNFDTFFNDIIPSLVSFYRMIDWLTITREEWYIIDRTIWYYYIAEQSLEIP